MERHGWRAGCTLLGVTALVVLVPLNLFVTQEGDATAGMREVTNNFLQSARRVTPSIEGINDAIEMAIHKPELDAPIATQGWWTYRSSHRSRTRVFPSSMSARGSKDSLIA